MFQTLVDANGMSVGLRVAAIWMISYKIERPIASECSVMNPERSLIVSMMWVLNLPVPECIEVSQIMRILTDCSEPCRIANLSGWTKPSGGSFHRSG